MITGQGQNPAQSLFRSGLEKVISAAIFGSDLEKDKGTGIQRINGTPIHCLHIYTL